MARGKLTKARLKQEVIARSVINKPIAKQYQNLSKKYLEEARDGNIVIVAKELKQCF
jgi:hypothetical protein